MGDIFDSGAPQRRPAGAASDGNRVIRGGAYNNSPRNLRSAYRNRRQPGNQNRNQGFRCVGPSSLEPIRAQGVRTSRVCR